MNPILAVFLYLMAALATRAQAAAADGQLFPYPDTPLPLAAEFSVKVNGQIVPVYKAGTFRCCPFAFSGPIQVEVTCNQGEVNACQINPAAKGISCQQQGRTIRFQLNQPQKIELQINHASSQVQDGDKFLYLFADAPEVNPPATNDPAVLYFGPGLHLQPGKTLTITDDDPHSALYVAPGAVLQACLEIKRNKKPFHVYGRGFIENPTTPEQKKIKKGNFALVLRSCHKVVVEDVIFFNSIWHGLKIFGGADNLIRNVKTLHVVVNSDGISLHDFASNNVVENSFIIGNDNLIVIGGGKSNVGPVNNTIRGCTFIKSSYAGNWAFPQGDGPIGPGNRVVDCDVIRCNGEVGLVRMFWAKPTTMDNLVFENIRVQSLDGYQPKPEKSNENRFLSLESDGLEFSRSLTFKNLFLPSAQTSFISPGKWTVVFDHVAVAGKVVQSDADLHLTKGKGVVTRYVY